MPIEISKDQNQNLTILVVTGISSEQEMHKALGDIYESAPTPLVLWDMSQADVSYVTPDMLQNFVRKAAHLGTFRPGGRTAVVAPGDLQYGLGRMSEIFADVESAPYALRVFRSKPDAMGWLTSETAG
jgi:hypothetical protein